MTAPAGSPTQDDSQIKHDVGKSDVGASGSRIVGCGSGVGNWYSVERQAAVGRSLAQQIELHTKFVSDPVVTEYVNRIGKNIVRNSDAQVPFTFKVSDSDVVNAMALPGGFFYINSGLLLAVDEEAEVAGIVAHEIAHVAACHAGRAWSTSDVAAMPSIPITLPPGGVDDMTRMGGILTFTRGFEAEADYLGIEYTHRAGYDPSALVSFFDKIHAMENVPWRPGAVAKSFATHPQNADRIEKSQKEIRSILPARQQYVVTNSEFDEVRARLAAIENKRKLLDKKNSNKPSVRRTSN
jgi:predicted Zn-dependent protease